MLPSSHIADVEKSMRYATERTERIHFNSLNVSVEGDHRDHIVTYEDGRWTCDCDGLAQQGYCSHTMTMERVLRDMVAMGVIDGPVLEVNGAA